MSNVIYGLPFGEPRPTEVNLDDYNDDIELQGDMRKAMVDVLEATDLLIGALNMRGYDTLPLLPTRDRIANALERGELTPIDQEDLIGLLADFDD